MAQPHDEPAKTPGYLYTPVLGGFDIAKKVADYLEDYRPRYYTGMNRAKTVALLNNVLHGRTTTTLNALVKKLEGVEAPDGQKRLQDILSQISLFQEQKGRIATAYEPPAGDTPMPKLRQDDVNGRQLNIVTQSVYDRAVVDGIPGDLFQNAYIDGVHFYCLPEETSFAGSILQDCKFNVCAARGAQFIDSTIYSSQFQTVDLSRAYFEGCSLAHTHFNDVDMTRAYFHASTIRHGNATNCKLLHTGFSLMQFDEVRFAKTIDPRIHAWSEVYTTFGAVSDTTKNYLASEMARELGLRPDNIQKPKRHRPRQPPQPEK